MADVTVGFAGMSHLGIVSAVAMAEKGFRTVGFDGDRATVAMLAQGRLPVVEPELPELLARNADKLRFVSEPSELAACDVVYVARDVPTDDEGVSNVAVISDLIAEITSHIRPAATIVILCQVPPGFTRHLAEVDPRFHYQVETLIFGRAVERALHPERFIVGKPDVTRPLPSAMKAVLQSFGCPILEMRLESAELAKISINMCLVASVSTANTLAGLCEKIGADWSEIIPALKLDARIGPQAYLKPGLGLSGGNLERDLATVRKLAAENGCDHGVVDAWTANSERRKLWPYQILEQFLLRSKPDARIAVLGLAYKENTHSVKNAASLALLEKLRGYDVAVYDPVVDAASVALGAEAASSALEAARDADAAVIITPWPEFGKLRPGDLADVMRGRLLVDPYALIDATQAVAAGFTHATLGAAIQRPGVTANA